MNKTMTIAIAALGLVSIAAANDKTQFKQMSGSQMNIIEQGVKSLSVSGSYVTQSGYHSTNIALSGSEFVTKNIEAILGFNYVDVNGSNSTGFTLGGRYYFDPSQDKSVLPFVGVFYGYNSGSGNTTSQYGFEGGLQYFLQPNISLTPELLWDSAHSNGITNNQFAVRVGLTYWFK